MSVLPVSVRLSRAVDGAVLWRLGIIGVTAPEGGHVHVGDPAAFWAAARLDRSGRLEEREIAVRRPLRAATRDPRARFVELTGASRGPGDHWGATHVRARAALHPDPAAPVVVVLHGYAVPAPWYEDRTMQQLLRRGISAVRVELPFHLSRRIPRQGPGRGFFSSDLPRTATVLRQSVEDTAAVVAWARRRGGGAVGLHGVSLGALVAALYAANRPVDAAMLVAPPCDLARVILETAPTRVRRRLDVVDGRGGAWGEDAAAARLVLEEMVAPVTPRRLRPRTEAERIVIVVADHDLVVGTLPVRELAAAWGTDLWSYPHGHVTVMTARGLVTRIHDRLEADLRRPAQLRAAG